MSPKFLWNGKPNYTKLPNSLKMDFEDAMTHAEKYFSISFFASMRSYSLTILTMSRALSTVKNFRRVLSQNCFS
jgi:hypothetical protein